MWLAWGRSFRCWDRLRFYSLLSGEHGIQQERKATEKQYGWYCSRYRWECNIRSSFVTSRKKHVRLWKAEFHHWQNVRGWKFRKTNSVVEDISVQMAILNDRATKAELRVVDFEARARRNNLIFISIPEIPNETDEQCEQMLFDFMAQRLQLTLSSSLCVSTGPPAQTAL